MKKIFKKLIAVTLSLSFVAGMFVSANAATVRKCYTINTGNTIAYTSSSLSTKIGTIYDSDELEVVSVTDRYTIVDYPTSKGAKRGYIPTSAILLNTTGSKFTATNKITTYKRPGGSSYGSISKGDVVTILGYTGNYVQVKYPVSYGYKYAMVTLSDAKNYLGVNGNINTTTNNKTDVQRRMDQIMDGSYKYNSSTNMKLDTKFTGTRSSEQCKGFAKNVFYMLFGVTPSSTRSKPYNYLINSTTGMTRVGYVTSMTTTNVKNLYSKARPGDFVQIRRSHTGSHSAIVYSVDNNGITFLEANTDGKNTVKLIYHTWQDLVDKNAGMSLYTASNYRLK